MRWDEAVAKRDKVCCVGAVETLRAGAKTQGASHGVHNKHVFVVSGPQVVRHTVGLLRSGEREDVHEPSRVVPHPSVIFDVPDGINNVGQGGAPKPLDCVGCGDVWMLVRRLGLQKISMMD